MEREKTEEKDGLGLKAVNLTPEELKASNVADRYLHSILVEFRSRTGVRYQAIHAINRAPGILLYGPEKYKDDFTESEKIIVEETGGVAEGKLFLTPGTRRISDFIALKELTQARMADLVVKYRTRFNDVAVPAAYFSGVPENIRKNHGFPVEKISVEKAPFYHNLDV